LAHLLGDFLLQPTLWVLDKESKKHKSKYLHPYFFTRNISLDFRWRNGIWMVYIGISLNTRRHRFDEIAIQNKTKRTWFVLDQILHLISIVMLDFIKLVC
jgi:hypothetical protein